MAPKLVLGHHIIHPSSGLFLSCYKFSRRLCSLVWRGLWGFGKALPQCSDPLSTFPIDLQELCLSRTSHLWSVLQMFSSPSVMVINPHTRHPGGEALALGDRVYQVFMMQELATGRGRASEPQLRRHHIPQPPARGLPGVSHGPLFLCPPPPAPFQGQLSSPHPSGILGCLCFS